MPWWGGGRIAVFALAIAPLPSLAIAQEARIAVAANFLEPAQTLARAFNDVTGHEISLSSGATGQLYAQIAQGAPFDGLLAADMERPHLLVEEGLAEPSSLFTYAVGRLALHSVERPVFGAEALKGKFSRLAIAEPASAPYGAAAIDVLEALGLTEALTDRVVIGQSIAQAYQFVATGNAELGFIAYAQVIGHDADSYWLVPDQLHTPIAQGAVVVAGAPRADVAAAFLDFLRSDEGKAIIASYGYDVPGGAE